MMWDLTDIVDVVVRGLQTRATADDLEQAVYSLDSLDELRLQPIIQQSLRDGGYGVWPEQRYPSDRPAKRKSEGRRCDIVLTPDGAPLLDPQAQGTLFEAPNASALESAFWLEIKTVGQYTTQGPFARYSAELLQPVSRDIKKLANDHLIYHAGLLLVLFNENLAIAKHDLVAWEAHCLKKGLAVGGPHHQKLQYHRQAGQRSAELRPLSHPPPLIGPAGTV